MYFLIAIIFFLVLILTAYGLYTQKFNWLQRFDLIIICTLGIFVIARVLGLIEFAGQVGLDWSLAPIREIDGNVEIFNTWPWVVLRIWDGVYLWNYPMLIFIGIAIVVEFLFKFKLQKFREFLNIYTIAFLTAIIFSLIALIILGLLNFLPIEINGVLVWLAGIVLALIAAILARKFGSNRSFDIAMLILIAAKFASYLLNIPSFNDQNFTFSLIESIIVMIFILVLWVLVKINQIIKSKAQSTRKQRIQRPIFSQ